MIAGSIRLALRCRRWNYPAFGALYFALMMFWHYPPDQRLFIPLSPFFAAGLWFEISNLWAMARKATARGKSQSGDRPVAYAFQAALSAFDYLIRTPAPAVAKAEDALELEVALQT